MYSSKAYTCASRDVSTHSHNCNKNNFACQNDKGFNVKMNLVEGIPPFYGRRGDGVGGGGSVRGCRPRLKMLSLISLF